MTTTAPTQTDIHFDADDGWRLHGTVYRGERPRLAVLVSAGTGFPRSFYRHFAADLAQRGAVVLCYDYRGIADSRGGSLRGSTIDYPDWGRLDAPAALEALHRAAPELPLTHAAHSVGGHFLGLMPNQ